MTRESKVTEQLMSLLERTPAEGLIDVVVELVPPEALQEPLRLSRGEQVTKLRESFERESAPVESMVRGVGGEVRGRAWINQTLRALLPRDAVNRICELDEVASLDLPSPLEAEAGS